MKNVFLFLRISVVAFSFVAPLLVDSISQPFPNYVAFVPLIFVPVMLLLYCGMQNLFRKDYAWLEPSWYANPFNPYQPLQFFHLFFWFFLAGAAGEALTAVLDGAENFNMALVMAFTGVGFFLGLLVCKRVFRTVREQNC